MEIHVYFDELKETFISESPKFQVQDLVANFGGTLGLCLGASFLSLAEFLELLIEILIIVWNKCKRKNLKIESGPSIHMKKSKASRQFEWEDFNAKVGALENENKQLQNMLIKSMKRIEHLEQRFELN